MERLPNETNMDFCRRWAKSIDKDTLIRQLLRQIEAMERRRRVGSRQPLWALIGEATDHGSGVSSAIVELYLPKESNESNESKDVANTKGDQSHAASQATPNNQPKGTP